MPKCSRCGREHDLLLLATPVYLLPHGDWLEYIKREKRAKHELLLAATELNKTGYFSIVTSRKYWRTQRALDKGFILAHELLHELKGLKKGRLEKEERAIQRFQANARLLEARQYDCVVSLRSRRLRMPIILLKAPKRRKG